MDQCPTTHFGESSMQRCEIMLNALIDSKRTKANIKATILQPSQAEAKFGDIWERLKASGVTYSQLSSYYQAYKLKAKASRPGEWSATAFLPYGMAAFSFGSFAMSIWNFVSVKNRDQIAVEAAAKRFEKEASARDELLKVQQDQLAELKKKNSSSWLWSWFSGKM